MRLHRHPWRGRLARNPCPCADAAAGLRVEMRTTKRLLITTVAPFLYRGQAAGGGKIFLTNPQTLPNLARGLGLARLPALS